MFRKEDKNKMMQPSVRVKAPVITSLVATWSANVHVNEFVSFNFSAVNVNY